jgi:hypothetical protein
LIKLTIAKTHTWQNIHLQNHTLAKKAKKQSTNGETLKQAHCSCCGKKKQQTYNVVFIWDKRPNLNLKPNFKLNLKAFFYYVLPLSNFDYARF